MFWRNLRAKTAVKVRVWLGQPGPLLHWGICVSLGLILVFVVLLVMFVVLLVMFVLEIPAGLGSLTWTSVELAQII